MSLDGGINQIDLKDGGGLFNDDSPLIVLKNKIVEFHDGIQAKIQGIYDYFDEIYESSVSETTKKKISYLNETKSHLISLAQSVKDVVNPLREAFSGPATEVASVVRQVSNVVNDVYHKIEKLMILSSVIKVGMIVRVPVLLYNLAWNIHKLVLGILIKSWKKVAFRAIRIFENLSDLTVVSALVVSGLAEFGKVALAVGAVAQVVLGYVSLVASVPMLFFECRKFNKSNKFEDKLQAHFDGAKGFSGVVEFLNGIDEIKLKKNFGVDDVELFKAQLQDILKTGDKAIQLKAMKALKKRVVTKSLCHILKIIAAIINVIASVIIVATPPNAAIGFGLYAIASAIIVSAVVVDKWSKSKLQNKIKDVLAPRLRLESKGLIRKRWNETIGKGWLKINGKGLDTIKSWKPKETEEAEEDKEKRFSRVSLKVGILETST